MATIKAQLNNIAEEICKSIMLMSDEAVDDELIKLGEDITKSESRIRMIIHEGITRNRGCEIELCKSGSKHLLPVHEGAHRVYVCRTCVDALGIAREGNLPDYAVVKKILAITYR